mmetsp:Transcript_25693/g.52729  ORF Transcript_25693/g.52729 Transcript_25693/m.52729 type:complete len:87 (+) Transcript_25693:2247-2507(+)
MMNLRCSSMMMLRLKQNLSPQLIRIGAQGDLADVQGTLYRWNRRYHRVSYLIHFVMYTIDYYCFLNIILCHTVEFRSYSILIICAS